MKERAWVLAVVCALALASESSAQSPAPPELGMGWMQEFTVTARQLLRLAETTPADKFAWRPAPGVRSISEVYVHLAVGTLFLLAEAGVTPMSDFGMPTLPQEPEKTITGKADVILWLRRSLDAVLQGYPRADKQKRVQLRGKETTSEGVFLRILVHANEHMGQSIAYARMNGVVPPWSKAP